MEHYETTPAFHVETLTLESLPSDPIQGMWARVSLMGHTTVLGQLFVVNVAAADCPIAMFKIVQPEMPAEPARLTRESDDWVAYKAYPFRPEKAHLLGRQAIFEIEPKDEAFVRAVLREQDQRALRPGRRGYSDIWEGYQEALKTVGLLVEGPWTEAHQEVVDAVDAADGLTPEKPKAYLEDLDDVNDPLALDEDED